MPAVLIESALDAYLSGKVPGTPNENAYPAKRATAIEELSHLVGRAWFSGRVPQNYHSYHPPGSQTSRTACTIEPGFSDPEYVLDDEYAIQKAAVGLSVYSKDYQAARICRLIWETIRMAASGYVGTWSYNNPDSSETVVEIHGCQTYQSNYQPINLGDGSESLHVLRGFIDVTYRQEVASV